MFRRFNLAIEMLVISGHHHVHGLVGFSSFNLAIEMLVISGIESAGAEFWVGLTVSISQSRCLSFQVLLLAPTFYSH